MGLLNEWIKRNCYLFYFFSGVTPTINTALLSSNTRPGYHGNGHTQWGGLSSNSDSTAPNVVAEGSTSALIINDIRNSTGALISHSESTSMSHTWAPDRRGSFSTSTMETTVATTPGESTASSHPKSQNINAKMNQSVLPHQGRNPIVERNTHKSSDEELAVVGRLRSSFQIQTLISKIIISWILVLWSESLGFVETRNSSSFKKMDLPLTN